MSEGSTLHYRSASTPLTPSMLLQLPASIGIITKSEANIAFETKIERVSMRSAIRIATKLANMQISITAINPKIESCGTNKTYFVKNMVRQRLN